MSYNGEMLLIEILKEALEKGASDIFILSGASIGYRISGNIYRKDDDKLTSKDTKYYVDEDGKNVKTW